MTTIHTIEDLMRILDENPEWLEAMRVRLLTRELIDLPRVVADLSRVVADLAKSMDERFDRVDERLAGHDERFVSIDERFDKVDERFDAIDRRFDKVESDIQGLRDDIAPLKGAHARNAVIENVDLLVEGMGLTWKRTLSRQEIAELVRSSDTSGIARNDLVSFRMADLIVECADAAGGTHYAAVEVSFTVNGRDTHRAVRNAGYLERFTGCTARAVVAGLRMDDRIRENVESGEVFWYAIHPEALSVEAE